MNDQRQPRLPRGGDVVAKALLLRLARAVVVEVVEARLADGDDLGMRGEAHDLLDGNVELLVGIVGMRADRAEDVGDALGNLQQSRRGGDARGDRDQHADARRLGARDHAVELIGKSGKSRWQW